MSLNAKKWQAKYSELQKTLDDVILMKEESLEKANHIDKKANILYELMNVSFFVSRLSF